VSARPRVDAQVRPYAYLVSMRRIFFAAFAAFAFSRVAAAQYSVRRAPDLVQLEDSARQVVVAIAPSAGNLTREMTVKGHNILGPQGIPFLAPWANRLDEQAFYANGRRYAFNMQLGNVRGAHPIHGFLSAAQWEVVEAKADASSAWVTSIWSSSSSRTGWRSFRSRTPSASRTA